MAEFGLVKKTDGDYAVLELTRSEACKHCNACLPTLTGKAMTLRAQNACKAKAGDYVSVEVQQDGFLSAVFYLYVIPALVFIALIVFLSFLKLNEWMVLGLSLMGLVIVYLLLHHFIPHLNLKRYIPVATAILDPPSKKE